MTKKAKKLPRVGFRRRVNPYYGNMNRRQITADVAKTAMKWVIFTVLAFLYWLVLLLLLSIFLLNVWKVTFPEILILSGILCGVSALVYAAVLVHRKFYY